MRTTMPFPSLIETMVRDLWAEHEGHSLVYARIPVPGHLAVSDIPILPECRSIEIERKDGVTRLVFWKVREP